MVIRRQRGAPVLTAVGRVFQSAARAAHCAEGNAAAAHGASRTSAVGDVQCAGGRIRSDACAGRSLAYLRGVAAATIGAEYRCDDGLSRAGLVIRRQCGAPVLAAVSRVLQSAARAAHCAEGNAAAAHGASRTSAVGDVQRTSGCGRSDTCAGRRRYARRSRAGGIGIRIAQAAGLDGESGCVGGQGARPSAAVDIILNAAACGATHGGHCNAAAGNGATRAAGAVGDLHFARGGVDHRAASSRRIEGKRLKCLTAAAIRYHDVIVAGA